MNAPYDNPWTMARFLEWTFGPRPLFETAKLVHEAGLLAEEVITRPEDPEPRRALQRRLVEVRNCADFRLWWEEGNAAASLVWGLRAAAAPCSFGPELRAGIFALEEQIRARLASAVLLQLRQGMAA